MGILKVEDEHQATALTLSSCSNSCSNLVEITPKGSQNGYEEAPERGIKIKKSVRFEEGCNQIIFFTSAAITHASKKVLCICAPATHVGSFKCRLHRENSNHRFHSHRSSSSSPWIVKHGSRGPKIFGHGGFASQTQHSRLGRIAATNVQQVSAAVHQMHLAK